MEESKNFADNGRVWTTHLCTRLQGVSGLCHRHPTSLRDVETLYFVLLASKAQLRLKI